MDDNSNSVNGSPWLLDALIEAAERQARQILIGTHEQLCPTFVLHGPQGIQVIGTPFRNDAEKEAVLIMMRRRMLDERITAYSWLGEGWSALMPKDYKVGDPITPRPANRPDRREVVVAVATDGFQTKWLYLEIERDQCGRCKQLIKKTSQNSDFAGRFANLLGGQA